MTKDDRDGQDEWAGWQWRRRRDRWLLIARITLTGLTIYTLLLVYEAVSTGVVLEISRGLDRETHSLATDPNAYFYHLSKWCIWLGLLSIATVGVWFYVKKADHPPE